MPTTVQVFRVKCPCQDSCPPVKDIHILGERIENVSVIAVVDTETSRHPASQNNRLVEVAIILWDAASDALITEIETLVNPNSIIEEGSAAIHKLAASDLEAAPSFSEISNWLPHFLDDRVVCGFNVNFDLRILNAEFMRVESNFAISQSFCARNQIPGNTQRGGLQEVCDGLGVEIRNAHTALGDARATLEVLRNYGLERVVDEARGKKHSWADRTRNFRPLTWSRYKAGLSEDFDLRRANFLWEIEDLDEESQYFGLLSSVLEDRALSDDEEDARQFFIAKAGFSPGRVTELHHEYVEILEARAIANRTVSDLEVKRISAMAELLGVKSSLIPTDSAHALIPDSGLICVTGTASVSHESWGYKRLERLIRRIGCVPTDELNRKDGVRLLLCSDIHTRTGKGQRADQWGIPKMSIADFLKRVSEEGVDLSQF